MIKFCAAVAICFASSFAAAGQVGSQPFAFFIRNAEIDTSIRDAIVNLQLEFAANPEDRRFGTAVPPRLAVLKCDYPRVPVTGVAHYAGPNGTILSCRVVDGVTREAFDRLVENEKLTRPDVQFSDNGRLTLGRGTSLNDGVTRSYSSVSYLFEEGLVVWGGEFVLKLNAAKLRGMVNKSRGYHAGMIVDNKQGSQMVRDRLFMKYALGWGVQMQQRRGEVAEVFSVRSEIYSILTDTLKSFVRDLDSMEFLIRFPAIGAPYDVRLKMKFAKGSDSSTMLRSLQVEKRFGHRKFDGNTVDAALNVKLPVEVRPLISSLGQYYSPEMAKAVGLQEALKDGVLSVEWCDMKTSEGATQILTSLLTASSSLDAEPVPFGGTVHLGNEGGDQDLFWSVKQRGKFFECIVGCQELSIDVLDEFDGDDTVVSGVPFFRGRFDLGGVIGEGQSGSVSRLVDIAEASYLDHHLRRNTEFNMLLDNGRAIPLPESLTSRVTDEGDWKLEASASCTASGQLLDIRLSAGRELFGLYSAFVLRSRQISRTFGTN